MSQSPKILPEAKGRKTHSHTSIIERIEHSCTHVIQLQYHILVIWYITKVFRINNENNKKSVELNKAVVQYKQLSSVTIQNSYLCNYFTFRKNKGKQTYQILSIMKHSQRTKSFTQNHLDGKLPCHSQLSCRWTNCNIRKKQSFWFRLKYRA